MYRIVYRIMRKNHIKLSYKIYFLIFCIIFILLVAIIAQILYNMQYKNAQYYNKLNKPSLQIVEKWEPYKQKYNNNIKTGNDPLNFYRKDMYKAPYNYPHNFHTDNPIPHTRFGD